MLRRGLGLLSENRKEEGLLLDQSIADNCTLTRLGPHTIATLVSRRRQQQATRTWIETLGIKTTGPAQTVGELSGGNQQKVALARLLHHDCTVLILDEPTRGVDIGAKATIYQQIGELAAAGKGILVISSYLPELLGICDTIGAMCRGVLSPLRPAEEWNAQSLLAATIGQEAA
jgi:ribose transport system ATP-binding protein